MTPPHNVTLIEFYKEQTGRNYRSFIAKLEPDGTLLFQGQDLGDAVEHIYGEGVREYEWCWTVEPASVPLLSTALNTENLMSALERKFSQHSSNSLLTFLRDHEIPFKVWSRMGD